MGNQFKVRNSKHEVQCDLEDGRSVISFKVKDRRNIKNPQHYIHYKRYKKFELPARIKAKFSTVAELHEHLSHHAEIITIGEKDIIIDLDGEKINVPFQNQNQESKIFCETQNMEIDTRRNQRQNGIQIVIGGQRPGQKHQALENGNQDEESKVIIKRVLKKMIKKNNPLRQFNFDGQGMKQLVQNVEKQWENFDRNGPVTPNMTKKKTQEVLEEKERPSSEIQALKVELQKKTKQLEKLTMRYENYKQDFNLEKFNEVARKQEQKIRKIALQQFLTEISDNLSKKSGNTNTTSIKVQMKTKDAFFSWMDNMTKELSDYRNHDNYLTVKKEAKQSKPKEFIQSKSESQFSVILEDLKMTEFQKLLISDRFDLDKQ